MYCFYFPVPTNWCAIRIIPLFPGYNQIDRQHDRPTPCAAHAPLIVASWAVYLAMARMLYGVVRELPLFSCSQDSVTQTEHNLLC